MKNIQIVILNKDRLEPLKLLVDSLRQRNYNNILVIDNESTYEPLLEWYNASSVEVFYNDIPETLFDTGTFGRLSGELQHPRFVDVIKNHYIFTDSDVVLETYVPDNFVDSMISIQEKYNTHKVGLGLKISDLPENTHTQQIKQIESQYWNNKINDSEYELYAAPIDTTFAVYGPNCVPFWAHGIRMGGSYVVKHMPWYYDYNNLPADEKYYLERLKAGRGPTYSMRIKNSIGI
jgi:hypothetical protein